jgi:hypothetical protein
LAHPSPRRALRRGPATPFPSPPSPRRRPRAAPPRPTSIYVPDSRAGWITKVTAYHDGKCVTGVRSHYGYNATGEQLLGREAGAAKELKLWPASGEFVVAALAKAGRCGRAPAARPGLMLQAPG